MRRNMFLTVAPLGKGRPEGFLEAMAYGIARKQTPSCPMYRQVNREVNNVLYRVIRAA